MMDFVDLVSYTVSHEFNIENFLLREIYNRFNFW